MGARTGRLAPRPHRGALGRLGVPLADGRTAVTVTEHGYRSGEARDLSLAGLEQCLDKMAVMFPARPAG